mgnify:CR=1 FL=1
MRLHILDHLIKNEWAIDRAYASRVLPWVMATVKADIATPDPTIQREKAEPQKVESDGIAYLFASGTVGKYMGMSESGIDLKDLDASLRAFAADPNFSTLILHIDSPGGTVYGVSQTAKLIERIRASGKTILGYTDTMACSAAQWIIAACDKVFVDQNADVGSIGVYSLILDASKFYEEQGLSFEMFASGKYKGMGMEMFTLTDEQRILIRERTEALAAQFRIEMQRMRGPIDPSAMEGQSIRAADAITANLADFLVDSIDDVIEYAKSLKTNN